MNLKTYGWNNVLEKDFETYSKEGYKAGRILFENTGIYKVYTEIGEVYARVSGKYQYQAQGKGDYPAVGDWVVISIREEEKSATIHSILPRKSHFSRLNPGPIEEEQVIAANFDYVFIITSLNHNFNLRRIERYLTIAWNSGGMPIIILSKADLCDDVDERLEKVQDIAPAVPIHVISSYTGDGVAEILKYFREGITATVVGSSGVGKSTLLNKLAGEELMETSEIREDDSRGRHTTTHRQLFLLPCGGMIIDTPGTRLIGIWDADEGISDVFQDITDLASGCKFSDCQHISEPGCQVQKALNEGTLDSKRYESYLKLKKEMTHIESKQNQMVRMQQKKNMKDLTKSSRNRGKLVY